MFCGKQIHNQFFRSKNFVSSLKKKKKKKKSQNCRKDWSLKYN